MIKVIKAAILKLSGNRQFCWGILSKVIKIIKMIKIASHFLNLRGRLNTKRRRREVGDGGTTGDSPPEPRGFAGECLDEPKGINQITVAILLVAMATHVFSFQRPLRNFGRRPIILGVGNVRRDMVGDNGVRLHARRKETVARSADWLSAIRFQRSAIPGEDRGFRRWALIRARLRPRRGFTVPISGSYRIGIAASLPQLLWAAAAATIRTTKETKVHKGYIYHEFTIPVGRSCGIEDYGVPD